MGGFIWKVLLVITVSMAAPGCFATLGFGATAPTSGDVEGDIAPSAEVAIGFAYDFDRFFLSAGTGGHVIRATSSVDGGNVVHTTRYNLRGDYTLFRTPVLRNSTNFYLRATTMSWFNGCALEVSDVEEDCSGSNFMAFAGATAAMGVAPLGHMSLSVGPTLWRANGADTGGLSGVGVKAFFTLYASTWRSGGGIFSGVARNMKEDLEYNNAMKRYRRDKAEWDRCRRTSSNCGSAPRRPSKYK